MVGGGGGGGGRGVKGFLNNDKKLKNRYFGASLILLKGLCAKSARAGSGRRCPHRREGEDFFTYVN